MSGRRPQRTQAWNFRDHFREPRGGLWCARGSSLVSTRCCCRGQLDCECSSGQTDRATELSQHTDPPSIQWERDSADGGWPPLDLLPWLVQAAQLHRANCRSACLPACLPACLDPKWWAAARISGARWRQAVPRRLPAVQRRHQLARRWAVLVCGPRIRSRPRQEAVSAGAPCALAPAASLRCGLLISCVDRVPQMHQRFRGGSGAARVSRLVTQPYGVHRPRQPRGGRPNSIICGAAQPSTPRPYYASQMLLRCSTTSITPQLSTRPTASPSSWVSDCVRAVFHGRFLRDRALARADIVETTA
eukprot:COSAG01_NODE_2252_length_8074_cov_37.778809_5_plen_304_part_00